LTNIGYDELVSNNSLVKSLTQISVLDQQAERSSQGNQDGGGGQGHRQVSAHEHAGKGAEMQGNPFLPSSTILIMRGLKIPPNCTNLHSLKKGKVIYRFSTHACLLFSSCLEKEMFLESKCFDWR
jgi:hypothetical protein